MCGIIGLYLKNGALRPKLGELFAPMLSQMRSRGPDSAGIAFYRNSVTDDETMHKSERGCVVGQGELKKKAFDKLFSVNHSFATMRAKINRLNRRTWCTTKLPERLADHIDIFIDISAPI